MGQCGCSSTGNGDALLFLFVYPHFHGLYQCWASGGRDLLLSHLLPHGGLGLPGAADERVRHPCGGVVCAAGAGHCRNRRHASAKAGDGTVCGGFHPPCAPHRKPERHPDPARSCRLCQGAAGEHGEKGGPVCFPGRGYRRTDSQRGAPDLGGDGAGQPKSSGGDSGHSGRSAHVCGYFRHHPRGGEFAV